MILLILVFVAIYLLLFTKEKFAVDNLSEEDLERLKSLKEEKEKLIKEHTSEPLSDKEFNAATNSLFFNLKNDIDKANVIKVLIGMIKQKTISVGEARKSKKMSESQLVRLTEEIKNNT